MNKIQKKRAKTAKLRRKYEFSFKKVYSLTKSHAEIAS